jgi:hypothetical protein
MAHLLERPVSEFTAWWPKAPQWKKTEPKNYSSWIDGHTSAFLPPVLADTRSKPAPHAFWDAFLPLFDKYYRALDGVFAAAEVRADQHALARLADRHAMTLGEGFASFESFKIRGLSKLPDGKFSFEATDRVTETDMDAAAGRWRPEQV